MDTSAIFSGVRSRIRSFLIFPAITGAALLLMLAQPVYGADDLEQEVERLREENRELRREIEHARTQIRDLQRALADARGEPRPVFEDEDEEVTVDESIPTASPRALFNALARTYVDATKDLPIGESGTRERRLYLRAIERWRNITAREMRGQIEWHVHIIEATPVRGGYTMNVVAIDPETKAELGDPFQVSTGRTIATQYDRAVERHQAKHFVLRGSLIPQVRINERRRQRGMFDKPPFIGPFAEFFFAVEPRALLLPEEVEEAAEDVN